MTRASQRAARDRWIRGEFGTPNSLYRPERPTFEVGDRVRVLQSDRHQGYRAGDERVVVEVYGANPATALYRIGHEEGGKGGPLMNPYQLAKLLG